MSQPFIGEVRMFGFNYAPRGWAHCNGAIVPISENSALFSILGTRFGGDGRTTFGLPNLQGRAPMHPGHGPGLQQSYLWGQWGGNSAIELYTQHIPEHTHSFKAAQMIGTTNDPTNSFPAGHQDDQYGKMYKTVDPPLDATFDSSAVHVSGGGNYHENRQPFLTVNFCIATIGMYPSRN